MSAYVKATNFATKDTLPTGDANKIVKGTEIDNEFNAIAGAISSKADTASPALTGTPTTPTATAGTNTTQIANCAFVLANGVPSGVITMWSGSVESIPSGWVFCNGSNGTPDLRSRFVVGAATTSAVGGTGGSADAVVVAHTHSISFNTSTASSNHTHNLSWNNPAGGNAVFYAQTTGSGASLTAGYTGGYPVAAINPYTEAAGADHVHAVSGNTASSGGSATNANLPPYYALAYIMKS